MERSAKAGIHDGTDPASAARRVVLVIEDEADITLLLESILSESYCVFCSSDGREGLEKALEVRPDLILCDLMMEGMSGGDIVRAARALPELRAVPIVVLTAIRDARLRAELLRDGAQDYLTKPFEAEELLARVAHHIAVTRARNALRAGVTSESESHPVAAQDLAELAAQVTAQKRTLENTLETTLETLRRSRALYHTLARDFAHATGVFFDTDLRFTAVQGEGFPRLSENEVIGKTVGEVFAPALSAILEPHLRAALSGIATTFELPDADNAGRLSLVRALPVEDESGNITGGLAVIQNLREHQLEEAEWQSFQARILSQVEDAVNAIGPEQRILYWNHAAERLYGISAEDALGRNLSEIYTYEWVGVERAVVLEALERDGWWKGECLHRLIRDEREISVEVSISLLREPSGQKVGFLAVIRDITARKRAEESRELLETERDGLLKRLQAENEETCRLQERLHLQIERMPIGCILWDTEFRVVSWNPAASKIFGYQSDEVLNQHAFALLVPDEAQEQVQQVWQRLLSGDTTANSINENRTREGRTIFCEWSNTPLTAPDGSVSGVLSMVQNITARVEAEEALRRSEEHFRVTFEEAAVGVAHISTTGHWLRVNQKICDILGYSREELLGGMSFQDLTHPDDLDRNVSLLEAAVRGEKPSYSLEKRYIRKNGQEIWCSVTSSYSPENRVDEQYLIGVVTDITAKKQAENTQRILSEAGAALAASLDYETTIETLGRLCVPGLADFCVIDLVVSPAPDGQEQNTPPVMRRALAQHADSAQSSVAEMLLQTPLFPGKLAADVQTSAQSRLIPEITREMLSGASQNDEQLLALQALEQHSMVVAPLAARGGVIGVVTLLNGTKRRPLSEHDLHLAEELLRRTALALENALLYSEAEKARHEAEAANRAKDEFLAVVSHELRTPLTPILGWVSMLREDGGEGTPGALDDETRAHALFTIQRSAEIQAQLIDDLLDVSRIISGNARLHLQFVDLRPIVEAALEAARVPAVEKNIALWTSFDPALGVVEGDGRRLQQVVANLLSNAIKFTPDGGRVEVQLAEKDGRAELMVSDTGIGIEPEFLPQVFERFSQADASASRIFGGLGLGLAIARHVVELHGGTIRASSEGRGKGATVFVSLPVPRPVKSMTGEVIAGALVPKSPEDSTQMSALFKNTVLATKRLLVVDDEPATRDMLAQVLRHSGAIVETADSARAARAILARWQPDVMVCDIGMPGEDGYTFIKFLRALHPDDGGDLPAIALTAYARPEDRQRALAAGFNRHISKPGALSDLILAVVELLPH